MSAPDTGATHDPTTMPSGGTEDLDELLGMLDGLAGELRALREDRAPTDPDVTTTGEVDAAELAGTSGQAQENRAIQHSRARLAVGRARAARAGLSDIADRARELGETLRDERARRAARDDGRDGARELEHAMVAALDGATRDLERSEDPDEAVERVAVGAVSGIPGVDHAAITIRNRRGAIIRGAASDDVARLLREVQAEAGSGPCPAVAAGQEVVEYRDLVTAETPWPRFARTAAELGVHGVLSVRLSDGVRVGSLTLYTREPDAFDDTTRLLAHVVARHAATALGGAERIRGLVRAVESRDLIGQAKGILMTRRGVDADAAFQMLVSSSQDTNLKLVDVARWVVDTLAHEELPD